ncbi:MAG: FMN-binding negative transcriptional regulator [Betaproteobacteria bacterium]|nr:FMN-binding negative transcriptional regulator [Betaproteobacteria bacterium]
MDTTASSHQCGGPGSEQAHCQPHPWSIHDAPPDYIDQMARVVTGIEMVVERLVGKWNMIAKRWGTAGRLSRA